MLSTRGLTLQSVKNGTGAGAGAGAGTGAGAGAGAGGDGTLNDRIRTNYSYSEQWPSQKGAAPSHQKKIWLLGFTQNCITAKTLRE